MCQGKFKTPQIEKKCDFFTICTSTYKHPLSNYFGIRKYHLSYNILATPEKLKIERKKERKNKKKREKYINTTIFKPQLCNKRTLTSRWLHKSISLSLKELAPEVSSHVKRLPKIRCAKTLNFSNSTNYSDFYWVNLVIKRRNRMKEICGTSSDIPKGLALFKTCSESAVW